MTSPTSLVAQLVKNPPAMPETSFRSLSWEDPLEKGKATHASILAWRIQSMGPELDTTDQLSLHFTYLLAPLLMHLCTYTGIDGSLLSRTENGYMKFYIYIGLFLYIWLNVFLN